MLTFPSAPTVAPGDLITSSQLAGLADAFNARIRSGLGDPVFRIFFYFFSLFRQIRKPDETFFLYPPNAEFFEVYQPIEPEDAQWPVSGPDQPEGALPGNDAAGFVFGDAAAGVNSEDVRLSDPGAGGLDFWPGSAPPSTPADYWLLGKLQRGAYDPVSGAVGSPAFRAAREFYKLVHNWFSPHGHSYGGFVPTPVILGDCGDSTPDKDATTNYEIFFTKLVTTVACPANTTTSGSKCIYPGSCPATNGHVAWIAAMPWAYYVFRVGGVVDVLSTKQFIIGPFTGGGSLRKMPSQILPRMMNAFVREFRGSDEQRSEEGYYLENSFPFQKFMTNQYLLAPVVGREMSGDVVPEYPLFRFSGAATVNRGTNAMHVQSGGRTKTCEANSTVASFYLQATGLAEPCQVDFVNDGVFARQETLTPVNGTATALVVLPTAKKGTYAFILGTDARFTSAAGKIEVEVAELYDYKPEMHDLYLALRCASAIVAEPDGRGIDESEAKEMGEDYFKFGCIRNRREHAGLMEHTAAINQHATFDAARRWSQYVRCIARRNFIGYEVTGGKSILYFTRYAYGLKGDVAADLFKGIAPGRLQVSSGAIKWGRSYIVRTGNIVYNGQSFFANQTFTGVRDIGDFSGSGTVYEYEGIYAAAPPQDFTNEWVLDFQFTVYHWSESSIWKASAYSDYIALSNRCHFRSNTSEGKADLRWHFQFGAFKFTSPEAPSGYNYVHSTNAGNADHFKSCRVYEPPVEIESAVVLIENGEEVVKLTMTGRVHNTNGEASGAPASVVRDYTTWSAATIALEPFRTAENALREYLLNQFAGVHCTRGSFGGNQEGNSGWQSQVWGEPDNPYGACYPHFLFCKLIPEPYADTNSSMDRHDSKILHDQMNQMETYLRAMCEGAVDTVTSQALSCDFATEALADYTYENLMFDASGGTSSWMPALAAVQRGDRAQGFGPLPDFTTYAEVFNLFSKAINLLTRFRVALPLKVECRSQNYETVKEVDGVSTFDGTALTCSTSGVLRGYYEDKPPAASTLTSTGAWGDCNSFGAATFATIDNATCGAGGKFNLRSTRTDYEFRMAWSNTDAQYAVPPTWRDMLTTHFGVLGTKQASTGTTTKSTVSDVSQSSECCAVAFQPCPGFWNKSDGTWWKWTAGGVTGPATCFLITSGTITAEALGSNAYAIGRNAAGFNCNTSTQNSLNVVVSLDSDVSYVEIPLV